MRSDVITRTTPAEALPELLFVAEAAAWLGIGKTLCYELVQRGELPSVKLGRLVRVQRDGLIAMAKKGQP
jgi:excisionase family DNA binding protein